MLIKTENIDMSYADFLVNYGIISHDRMPQ